MNKSSISDREYVYLCLNSFTTESAALGDYEFLAYAII